MSITETKPKHPGGRPTDYTPEKGREICRRLSRGRSIRDICTDDDMPSRHAVYEWIAKHDEFRDQYARAREACLEYYADDIIEIADDTSNDFIERQGDDGEELPPLVNHEHINRSRLRIDTRKWLMSKLLPKKYGDKIEVQSEAKVEHSVNVDALQSDELIRLAELVRLIKEKPEEPVLIGSSSTVNGSGRKANGKAR